jgi:hypothetical protein
VVETHTKPFVLLNCHCSNCRRSSGHDYETVSVFLLFAVKPSFEGPVQCDTSKGWMGLTGVERTTRVNCKDRFTGDRGIRACTGLFFCNSDLLVWKGESGDSREEDVKPSVDICCQSGLQKDDAASLKGARHPIMHSDTGSCLFSAWVALAAGVPQLVGLLWRLAWRKAVSSLRQTVPKRRTGLCVRLCDEL